MKITPLNLLDTAMAALDQHDIPYHADPDTHLLSGSLRGDNATWRFLIETFENDQERGVVIVSFLPINVPPHRRGAVAELLTRINFYKAMAFFAMDMDDGEVVCKSGIDLMDAELTENMFDSMFFLNAHTLDRYLPAIMQVCYSQINPEEALTAVEIHSTMQ